MLLEGNTGCSPALFHNS